MKKPVTTPLTAPRVAIGTQVIPPGQIQSLGAADLRVGPTSYRNASPFVYGGGNIMAVPRIESATREVVRERRQAVANARKVDRDNPNIRAGITKRAVNIVGADLKLKCRPNWKALGMSKEVGTKFAREMAAQVEPHFEVWANDPRLLSDAQRRCTFGANMLLAARNAFGAEGECMVISRFDSKRQRKYRAQFATFIEVIDPDRISTPEGKQDSDTLIAGKQLDEYGAATGFWIERTHPSDARGARKWTLIPREDKWGRPIGIHWYFQSRAGAQRAMPAIIASLRHVKMLEDFDDATLQSAVINAILSIFIESDMSSSEVLAKLQAAPTGGASRDPLNALWDKRFDFYNKEELQANGVRIPVLPPGDKIHMETANRAADSTKDFRAAFQRSFAAELHLNHEMFSGDYTGGSFSTARQSLIDLWRIVTCDRHLFTSHVATQVYVGLLEELFITNAIQLPPGAPDFWDNIAAYSGCEFVGPGMGWVDPNKDIEASNKRVASGMGNIRDEAFNQGVDVHRNIDDLAAVHEYAREAGVMLPTMIAEQELANETKMANKPVSQSPSNPGAPDNPDDPEDDNPDVTGDEQ